MRCAYCIARDLNVATMDKEVGQAAIDMFIYLSEGAKFLEITFTGGEPLLNFEALKYLTYYAKNRAYEAGMDVNFVLKTNGTLLNKEIKKFLEKENIKVVLSIDGKPKAHNKYRNFVNGEKTHHIVSENLKDLLSRGISCIASLTIHPSQAKTLLENVRYLHQLGADKIDIGPVYGTIVWAENTITDLIMSLYNVAMYMRETRKTEEGLEVGPLYLESEHVGGILSDKWGCKAGLTQLAFLPNGQITGCSALAMLVSSFPELIIGDVKVGLDDFAVQHLIQQTQATIKNRLSCQKCKTAINCTGGCLAINYAVNGMPFSPPPFYCRTMHSIPKAWNIAWEDHKL